MLLWQYYVSVLNEIGYIVTSNISITIYYTSEVRESFNIV